MGPGEGGDQLHRRDVLHGVALAHRLTPQGDGQVGFAYSRRTEQQQGVAVGDPAAGGKFPDLARIRGGLGLVLEPLQRPRERELGDAHCHRDSPLILVGDLRRTQSGQRLAQVQLLYGDRRHRGHRL